MSITLTERAAVRINAFLKNRGGGLGLRLSVRSSGCTGMTYALEFTDELTIEDIIFEDKGVKVIVDSKILKFIDGTQLDFIKDGLSENFKFINPNVRNKCGCGKSFSVQY